MKLYHGVNKTLEAAANELIRESLEGVTRRADKSDILTAWKEQDRKRREVYSSSGVVDAAMRKGYFHRAWNPAHAHLNSREGIAPANRFSTSMFHDDVVDVIADEGEE